MTSITGRGAGIVFAKEVVDNLRDRRTPLAALLYPFLGPGLILLMVFAIGRLSKEAELPLKVPVEGREHAPSLIPFLERVEIFINRILRAEEVSPSHLLISSVTTLAAGAILLALVIRRYSREAILFRERLHPQFRAVRIAPSLLQA